MKTPSLGQAVLYAVLTDEAAQSFIAAAGVPIGEAVIKPLALAGSFRAAHVVGEAGTENSGRVALVVYKQPGDPFRDAGDAVLQRIADVPYSAAGAPGSWLYESDAAVLAKTANPAKGKPAGSGPRAV